MVFGVAAVLITGGGAVFAMRKRAPAPVDESTPERLRRRPAEVSFPEIRRAIDATESEAWLQGPDDARVAVGETPVTIGYTTDCSIVLPSSGGAREGRVRVWLRDGSYMLHNLSPRLGSVSVGGRPVTWVVLDDGDDFITTGALSDFRPADDTAIDLGAAAGGPAGVNVLTIERLTDLVESDFVFA